MVRPILPKAEQASPAHRPEPSAETKFSKRRCVSSACLPCRKRKSKCDGATPACSTCIAVYHTECAYELDDGHRRKQSSSGKEAEPSKDRGGGAAGVVLASLRTCTDAEAAEILQQLRCGESVDALAESLKSHAPLSSPPETASLEVDMADVTGMPTVGRSGETRYFGYTSSLGLAGNEDDTGAPSNNVHYQGRIESWTRVTQDQDLIGHLLSLYFCWQHPLYIVFSQDCFLQDMAHGRSKYCSALLVNAVLACSCAFAEPADARFGQSDFYALKTGFFSEAKRLLFEDERSCLTTVQALAIMSLTDAACGRDSSGFHYAGRCMRMALELGLHLDITGPGASRLTPTEIEVRKITFWGCFNMDTIWAVSVGRISVLPRSAVRVGKPSVTDATELKQWKVYGSPDPGRTEQPCHCYGLLLRMSALCEIINDAIYALYAPRERFTSRKLLDFYHRYQKWRKDLPKYLEINERPTPQVIYLHMLYNTVLLHLFRLLLRVDIVDCAFSPRDICTQAAESVSKLAEQYEGLYGLGRVCVILSHCLLSASTIHLLNLPSPSASHHLVRAVRNLCDMSARHSFAGRCVRVLYSLAQKWDIRLPEQVEQLMSGVRSGLQQQPPPSDYFPIFPIRNMSLDAFSETVVDLLPSVEQTPSSFASANSLFFAQFPYQGYPLQMEVEPGPMDISAMLDAQADYLERFSRDGFKTAPGRDPTFGGPGANSSNWSQHDWQ